MTTFTRALLCGLCLMLAVIMLAACGGESGNNAGTGAQTTASGNQETSAAETEPPVTELHDTLPDADYKGYKFRIYGETQSAGSDIFEVETLTGDVINDAVYDRNRNVESRYNTKLAFTLVGWKGGSGGISANTEDIRTRIMSGDGEIDLYTMTHLYAGHLLIEGCFVDWKQVKSVDTSLPCYVQDANETYSIGPAHPMLFGDFMETNLLRCWGFFFNKALAEDYKIEDPYKLVDEGKWTLDKLTELITGVYKDLDGDGTQSVNDLYGLAIDNLGNLDAFSRGCGIRAIAKDKDNLPVLNFWNESVVTAFEKIYKLYYETGSTYVHKSSLKHIEELFARGNAVFCGARLDYSLQGYMREMEDDYGILPYPKLDETIDKNYTYLSGTFSAQMIGVDRPETDWERTGTITQALNVYAHEMVIPAIYDVALKTKTARDEDSARMLDLILANRVYSFDSCDEQGFLLSPVKTLRARLGAKNKDIASYYASNKDSAQKWIDNMIETFKAASK